MISRKIEEFYQGKSLSIAVQDGEYAGQTVKVFLLGFFYLYLNKFNVLLKCFFLLKHVHVHILPRKPADFEENDTIYHEVSVL